MDLDCYELHTLDSDGNKHTFFVSESNYIDNNSHIDFFVYDNPALVGEFFTWRITFRDDNVAQSTAIFRGDTDLYRAKGIPDALLPLTARNKRLLIESSPNKTSSDTTNWREPDADKMWLRLKEKGIAQHDEDRDIYYNDGRSSTPA